MSCGCLKDVWRVFEGCLDGVSQDRSNQGKIVGQVKTGQAKTGQVKTGHVKTGQVKIGQVRTGQLRRRSI